MVSHSNADFIWIRYSDLDKSGANLHFFWIVVQIDSDNGFNPEDYHFIQISYILLIIHLSKATFPLETDIGTAYF